MSGSWMSRRSRSEKVLLAVFLGLVTTWAGIEGIGRLATSGRSAIEVETRRLEAELGRLHRLQESEPEIRARYQRLSSAREASEADASTRSADPLRRLERIASGRVRISKVYPVAAAADGTERTGSEDAFAVEFWDERGKLHEFLAALAVELGGNVTSFHAEMEEKTGSLRCQATIRFRKESGDA